MYDNEQSLITYGGLKELIIDLLTGNLTMDDFFERDNIFKNGEMSNEKLDDVLSRYELVE